VARLEYARQRKRKKVTETAAGQWSSRNMNGARHEETAGKKKVGQWKNSNMDGRKNEEKVTETAVGQ